MILFWQVLVVCVVMEWNGKSPSPWDWENHNLFSGSELGNDSSKILIEPDKDMQPNEQNKGRDVTGELGLKLGKRTYFEDVCAGNNNMTKNSNSATKKIRASQQLSSANYWCQVEGCNADLTGAKDYHRKHRVCDVHSKSFKVVVAGQERRFCQQCSRFHSLLEFDHKKRSCRRRLSDHNARRRKPQEETISFNAPSYCLPFYEDRQPVGFLLNRGPFSITKQNVSSTWNDSCGFSLAHSKESWINKPVKVEKIEHIQFSDSGTSNLIPPLAFDTDKLVHFKGPAHEILGQGIEALVSVSNFDRSALSLLSTDSWASTNHAQSNIPQLINTNGDNELSGYWKYQTQPQETHPQQICVSPFDHHKSNGGAQLESPLFDSNQIL